MRERAPCTRPAGRRRRRSIRRRLGAGEHHEAGRIAGDAPGFVGHEDDRLLGRAGLPDLDLLAVEPGTDVGDVTGPHDVGQALDVAPGRGG
jgi:hypothetical protein